jgi:cysteine synthase A
LLINLRSNGCQDLFDPCSDPYSYQNLSNYEAHFDGTGPEIWRQTNGNIKAFVSGAGERTCLSSNHLLSNTFQGTGGTIAGVGTYLKSRDNGIIVCLADPEGSGLHNKVHSIIWSE